MHLIHRHTCRVCGSTALTTVNDLGEQYLQGSFIKPGKEVPPSRKIPLTLVRCDPTLDEDACGLLQLAHSTPAEVLYSAYWYRSGTNQTMRDHLRGIAEQAWTILDRPNARVLDIGCNDGTLLSYYPATAERFGVDPSDIASEVDLPGVSVFQDVFPSPVLDRETGGGFDLITAIAMFYDLEDPVGFVKEVRKSLQPDGLWVFEMSYMPSMLRMNSYDTICHEHLEYYSLAVLEKILKRGGMKMVHAELNEINGGSIRCFATHEGSNRYVNLERKGALTGLRFREFDLELDTDRPYRNFQEHINVHREELRALLRQLKQDGMKIHVYGASTKGNTILQWCNIDATLIPYAADRNPEKHGARTLGSEIEIISEDESRAMNPDFYMVLPRHFREEFLEREANTIASGTRMIFPLPSVQVIG
jgi:SAM-dependent methyltransferase